MCIISWNKAFCLFPNNTFVKRETYLLDVVRPDGTPGIRASFLRKTAKYGLRVKLRHWDRFAPKTAANAAREDRSFNELEHRRRLADKHSWTIDLPTSGITAPRTPDFILDSASFKLCGDIPRGRNPYERHQGYILRSKALESPILQHTYLYVPEGDGTGWGELQKELDILTLLELKKLREEERPAFYGRLSAQPQLVNDLMRGWKVPSSWAFYDDDMRQLVGRVLGTEE